MLTSERIEEAMESARKVRPDRLKMIRRRCQAAENGLAVENLQFTAVSDISFLLAKIDHYRTIEHRYHRMLLQQLAAMSSQGTGPETVYFSDGLNG